MDEQRRARSQGRATIATGLGALVIVLLVVVFVDRRGAGDSDGVTAAGEGAAAAGAGAAGPPAASGSPGAGAAGAGAGTGDDHHGRGHGHDHAPSALPAAATALMLPATTTVVVDPGQARLAELAAQPEAHVGERFRCRNLIAPLPQRWDATRDGLSRLLERTGLRLAPHRVTLVCEGGNLEVALAHAFAHTDRAALLRAARREAVLELRVLGAGPTGVLLAEIEAVAEPGAPIDTAQPDLVAALLAAAPPRGEQVRCRAEGGATLLDAARLPPAARAWAEREAAPRLPADADPAAAAVTAGGDARAPPAPPPAPAAALAEVRCLDRGGAPVPILLRLPRARVAELLQIRAGTMLALALEGAEDDRLLAQLVALAEGAAPTVRDPLRLALLDGVAAAGTATGCVSMGLPLPELLDDDGIGIPDAWGQRRAKVRAWLVCGGPVTAPTHVHLYFGERDAERLLEIGRGTELALRVLGSDGQRVQAELVNVASGGLDARSQAGDLRRYLVERARLAGSDVSCTVGRVEPLRSTAGVSRPGARLIAAQKLATGVDATPLRIECVDALRPYDGQPFEVYFADAEERVRAPLRVGAKVRLRFVGVRQNQPIAIYRGAMSSGPGEVRAAK